VRSRSRRCPRVDIDVGADCDDEDDRANPDAGFRADEPTPTTKGDWNCDRQIIREHAVNVNCAALLSTTCAGSQGFTGDPPCGQTGSYVVCSTNGLGCMAGAPKNATQRCK
jgi:hypothetical protein